MNARTAKLINRAAAIDSTPARAWLRAAPAQRAAMRQKLQAAVGARTCPVTPPL